MNTRSLPASRREPAWAAALRRAFCIALALGTVQAAANTTIVVDDGSDSASCAGGSYTLRCAITFANANAFTNIRFAPGLTAVLLLGSLPTITGNGTWIDGTDSVGTYVGPRIDGAFWSGPAGDAMTINANDVTISNIKIVAIPAGGGHKDIRIAGGKDIAIAYDYLGILPGAVNCPASAADVGIEIAANTSGASGAGNGVAYIFSSVISCHGDDGVDNLGANFVSIGLDRGNNPAGNYIGTASDGMHGAGNGNLGIYSVGLNTTFEHNLVEFNGSGGILDQGTGTTIYDNVISSNDGNGVFLYGGSLQTVTGNDIGTTDDGIGAAANAGNGVRVLNGTGLYFANNTVAYNTLVGIDIEGDSHVLMQYNNVFSNGGLPVDLGNDGATPNGSKAAPGPNDWIGYPVISSASGNVITGFSCGGCYVTIFHAIGDPSRAGGGGTYLDTVLANALGNWGATLPAGMTAQDISLSASSYDALQPSTWDSSEMSPRDYIFRDGFQ
jgi:parallel beta-helix repeat protein